jgi:hypothetical protein
VRIGPDDEAPGQSEASFGQNLVTYPLVHIVKIWNALLGNKFSEFGVIAGCLYRSRRGLMIEHHDDPLRIPNFFNTDLAQGVDGERGGDIVDHRHVNLCFNDFSGRHLLLSSSHRQNFFGCRHAHVITDESPLQPPS